MSEEAGHHERRKYFRVQTFARVSLRLLQRSEDVEAARARLKVRHVPAMTPGTLNDLRMSPEARPVIELLQRIAFTLDRMDRKLDSILQADPARGEPMASQALAVRSSRSTTACRCPSYPHRPRNSSPGARATARASSTPGPPGSTPHLFWPQLMSTRTPRETPAA